MKLKDKPALISDIFKYNECSILIIFNTNHQLFSLDWLLQKRSLLLDFYSDNILQVNSTYNSLLVIYNSTINDFYSTKMALKQLLLTNDEPFDFNFRSVIIPTCYDDEFSIDAKEFEQKKELSKQDLISLHSGQTYRVHFIGFLPGFPYLSQVNKDLYFPRKSQPRPKISAGSVGIAGRQTGIYPVNSPGGWQIIGQTPLCLFDAKQLKTFLKAGDTIRFKPINKKEYYKIKSELQQDINFQNRFVDES
ncbi:5-oxoprolinase subunit PxpB [Psychroflexus sp. ALD_RP9]|uniref:5-oxoprolinase subunit PxpB n=1 Tax=Psychroflexus sp. ALD_RP9 TaxID=2777186 RepID=UPI001A906111|nr:5-oxoprolinase subunit PxpB [Psychroflexus sp. ALD_RP9]QSS97276.1 5-oxoprolinase subunit PxpB [Psychroflexus sp. ALD_RP9]